MKYFVSVDDLANTEIIMLPIVRCSEDCSGECKNIVGYIPRDEIMHIKTEEELEKYLEKK